MAVGYRKVTAKNVNATLQILMRGSVPMTIYDLNGANCSNLCENSKSYLGSGLLYYR